MFRTKPLPSTMTQLWRDAQKEKDTHSVQLELLIAACVKNIKLLNERQLFYKSMLIQKLLQILDPLNSNIAKENKDLNSHTWTQAKDKIINFQVRLKAFRGLYKSDLTPGFLDDIDQIVFSLAPPSKKNEVKTIPKILPAKPKKEHKQSSIVSVESKSQPRMIEIKKQVRLNIDHMNGLQTECITSLQQHYANTSVKKEIESRRNENKILEKYLTKIFELIINTKWKVGLGGETIWDKKTKITLNVVPKNVAIIAQKIEKAILANGDLKSCLDELFEICKNVLINKSFWRDLSTIKFYENLMDGTNKILEQINFFASDEKFIPRPTSPRR